MQLRDPFASGRIEHSSAFRRRRLLNWFPLGLAYAMLYMGRYNLTVAQGSLGKDLMPKEAFGTIFMVGAVVYGLAFLFNGPLTDRIGGKRAMLLGLGGAFAANLGLGWYTYSVVGTDVDPGMLTLVFSLIYAVNMYFQSFGAVAIVKVNASWFHVRERGSFSGIFGIMISSGVFLAFDVNGRLLQWTAGTGPGGLDPTWLVFFVPAAGLAAMFLLELIFLRDTPALAGHEDLYTGDASSGESDDPVPGLQLIKRILSNPVIITLVAIEFCSGVLRNGVMHWFRIYAKEQAAFIGADPGWQWALLNWGLLLFVAGVIGGNVAGLVSDKVFGSRRAPAAFLLYSLLTISIVAMFFGMHNPWLLTGAVFFISLAVIGTHGLLSGTATMDFGGRKGAATAVGVIDGFVYLGTGFQSIALGYITGDGGWAWWPVFLLPFSLIGLVLLRRIWHAMPTGRKAVPAPAQPAPPPAAAAG